MSGSAAALRERLARVGAVKRAAAEEDARRHLTLALGARLEATLRLCDAHLAAFPDHVRSGAGAAADAECWATVRRRLAGTR